MRDQQKRCGRIDDPHALMFGDCQLRLIAGDHDLRFRGERGGDDGVVFGIGCEASNRFDDD